MSADNPTPRRVLPERPSLEQLRKQAKELVRAARRTGDDAITLADAQLSLAREYGFPSWPKLVHHVQAATGGGFALKPLIRPVDLRNDEVFAMFVASRAGDVATVKRLVSRTPSLATVEYNYTPPIHFAVREGHLDVTEFLLDHGADEAYRSYPFKESLLTFAEDRGHNQVAALLRGRLSRRFALAPTTDETGDTALHHAAKEGRLDVVRALVAEGADVDAVRGDGYRPIHCALMPQWFFQVKLGARDEIADLLLSHGARYTIFIAALRGDVQFVRDALARDRTLSNFEDTCHHRALSAAVRRGDVAMTRMLLEHGADPNLPEEGAPRGLSLWIAVNDREYEIVRLLLAAGADPNGDVESSGSPMSHAEGKDAELVELLRAHGGRQAGASGRERVGKLLEEGKLEEAEVLLRANPELIHDDEAGWGDGILAGPANSGRHDIITMLLRLGARVPSVSKWAPYYYFKHEKTAAFLLEHGMDPNHMNWHRFTLIHHMAAEGEVEKARLLIAHGASIDAIDDEYRSTPLGVAARFGQEALVKLLLESGADPVAAGEPWAVPLVWAEKKGHSRITDMLRPSATA